MPDPLAELDAHQLLQTYLTRSAPRRRGKGAEHKDWQKAEEDVERDLRLLATGSRTPPVPTVPHAATKVDKAEVLESFLDALEARVKELAEEDEIKLARKTRCAPLTANGQVDWKALRELVEAWSTAQAQKDDGEDGEDGEEEAVPEDAEELVELWDKHRAARRSKPKEKDFEALSEGRGDAPATPYGISRTFAVGEWMDHKKFGIGVVLEAHDKIRVRFEDQERVLVHVAAPPPPPAKKSGSKK